MNRSIKGLLQVIFFILLISRFGTISAQTDSASVAVRKFDQQSLQKYSAQKEFVYDAAPPQEMSIFSWLWYQFLRLLSKLFSTKQKITIWRVIMYLLMIFAIVMIVLNLMGIEVRRFLTRDARTIITPQIGEENIREMNMDDLIADAAAKKQWRLGVRYQYLKALRLLTDRELIRWQVGKTNMNYYYELKDEGLKSAFLTATDDFENAWYGNSEVTEEHYHDSKKSLENFYTQIQNYRA